MVVSRIHNNQAVVTGTGGIIPILQMRKQFLGEHVSCLRSLSWRVIVLRLNSKLHKEPIKLVAGGKCLWEGEPVQPRGVGLYSEGCEHRGAVFCTFAACCLALCQPVTGGLR